VRAAAFREFGGPEKIAWEEYPDPKPGPGEVVVRVRACSVNHLDAWVLSGIPAYKIKPPHAPGADIAGTIEELGAGVTGWHEGDPVVVYPIVACGRCVDCAAGRENLCGQRTVVGAGPRWGGYAEAVVIPEANLLQKPSTVSFEDAAAIPVNFLTAWNMLRTLGGLTKGQTVLVMGASAGVGAAALAIARHVGARILATSTDPEKRKRAKALGAAEVFDSADPELWMKVRGATGGRGADVVFEHIGPAVFKQAVQSLAPGGVLVTCGATTGPEASLDLRFVFSRQLSIRGAYLGTRRELAAVLGLFEQGTLKVETDSVFPAARAGEALRRLLDRKAFGKIILTHV
jgi:NADPH:quinone reductase-like Zn-dependent oxidoreductase